MSYQINTQVNFIIDGDEQNAGDRAFIRDARIVAIDGVEIGTAGLRQYLKDHHMIAIEGGAGAGGPGVKYHSTSHFLITGRPSGSSINVDKSFSL